MLLVEIGVGGRCRNNRMSVLFSPLLCVVSYHVVNTFLSRKLENSAVDHQKLFAPHAAIRKSKHPYKPRIRTIRNVMAQLDWLYNLSYA